MPDHQHAVEDTRRSTPAPKGAAPMMQPLVGRVLALQSLAGNRATAAYVPRAVHRTPPQSRGRRLARYVVEVGGEQVEVTDKTKETRMAEAKRIIDRLSSEFGITLDSKRALEAVRAGAPHKTEAERNKVGTLRWTFSELKAVEKAANHFKPILGKMRAASPRAAVPQEVTTVGKLDVAVLDAAAVGEYARGGQAVAMYQLGESAQGTFGLDIPKNAEMTATHEFAHGLVRYAVDGFYASMRPPYWLDAF